MKQGDEQDVAEGIVRAFEEATAGAVPEPTPPGDHPDAVRMMDEAFRRTEAALGSNVLPFPADRKKV